jgi:hypothetical protein
VVPTSYLAVVTLLDDPRFLDVARWRYRIQERSGVTGLDTLVAASARDTVVMAVPAATYSVELDGLPASCRARQGEEQFVQVLPGASTSLARFFVVCTRALSIQVAADGAPLDERFIWRLDGPMTGRTGLLGPLDSVVFDTLGPGRYTVSLGHVAAHCVVTSAGGAMVSVDVPREGGARVDFRVRCSDAARRPRVDRFAASYRDGVSGFVFQAADPDADLDHYVWDLTDCGGRSLLPGGARVRRGLGSGRTRGFDTVTVVGAFEVGLADSVARRGCTALRITDQLGNTTPILEVPTRTPDARAPTATGFNAVSLGSAVRTTLAVSDPDGDFVGTFVAAELRDGVISGALDGHPDIGIYNVAGYLGTVLPDLPLSDRIQFGDVYAVIVYLVDRAGNVTRLADRDLFR